MVPEPEQVWQRVEGVLQVRPLGLGRNPRAEEADDGWRGVHVGRVRGRHQHHPHAGAWVWLLLRPPEGWTSLRTSSQNPNPICPKLAGYSRSKASCRMRPEVRKMAGVCHRGQKQAFKSQVERLFRWETCFLGGVPKKVLAGGAKRALNLGRIRQEA